jgi:prepilin-type processing-associated H-X9-DG protein
LLPIFLGAKNTAKRTKCQSNLRLIGQAFSLYLSDWSDVYPNTNDPYLWMGRRWRWPLSRYIALTAKRDPSDQDNPNKSVGNTTGGILICPSDEQARMKWDATSYGYSAAFYHTPEQINSMTLANLWDPSNQGPPCTSQTISEVTYPSKKAIIADWNSNHSDDRVDWWHWEGSRNYLFVDGHVRYLRAKQIKPAGNDLPDINLTIDGLRGRDID